MERTKLSKEIVYIGIDPGSSSGGMAYIINRRCFCAQFKDMTEKELCDIFKSLSNMNSVAMIEKVHVMPGTGAQAATKFMTNYGMLLGFLLALDIPFKRITPQSWMKYYGMKKNSAETKTEWKKRLRQRAQELYPKSKIVTNTGDAVLIAEYCRNNW